MLARRECFDNEEVSPTADSNPAQNSGREKCFPRPYPENRPLVLWASGIPPPRPCQPRRVHLAHGEGILGLPPHFPASKPPGKRTGARMPLGMVDHRAGPRSPPPPASGPGPIQNPRELGGTALPGRAVGSRRELTGRTRHNCLPISGVGPVLQAECTSKGPEQTWANPPAPAKARPFIGAGSEPPRVPSICGSWLAEITSPNSDLSPEIRLPPRVAPNVPPAISPLFWTNRFGVFPVGAAVQESCRSSRDADRAKTRGFSHHV